MKRFEVRITFDVEVVSESAGAAENEAFEYMAEAAMQYRREEFEAETLTVSELKDYERAEYGMDEGRSGKGADQGVREGRTVRD